MPYVAIVIEEDDDDWMQPGHEDYLNSRMTLGLKTIEQMADYADKIAEKLNEPVVYILDIRLEIIDSTKTMTQYVAMSDGWPVGRRVVWKYNPSKGTRYTYLGGINNG